MATEVMPHVKRLRQEPGYNIGLLFQRSARREFSVFVVDTPHIPAMDVLDSYAYVAPLYLYPDLPGLTRQDRPENFGKTGYVQLRLM